MNDPTFAMTRRNPTTGGYRLAKAGAFAVLALMLSTSAQALGLGRLTVQSALGEPLRAEIEVSSITPAEEASLSLRIASAQAYRSAGIEFNEVLTATRLSLVRRPDGRAVLELRSDRPARDPFIDLILEASWASGRQVREYTLLINPASSAQASAGSSGVAVAAAITAPPPPAAPIASPASPVAPTPEAAAAAAVTPAATPQADGAPPAPASAPAAVNAATAPVPLQQAATSTALQPLEAAPAATPAPAPGPVPVSPAAARAPTSAAAQPASRPATAAGEPGKRHVVQAGETLYRVASQHRPEGVSLDQMLVSLYRDNPQAFAGRNMNRLMAGAVLTVPSADQALTVDETEAKGLIEAQSADFGAYRARLAAAVPQTAQEPAASRQASGRVQARVQDRKTQAAPTPDQLQLSQGGVKAASSPEASLSRNAAAREAARREAELARNVDALRQLQQMAGGAPAKAASSAAVGSGGGAGAAPAGASPSVSTAAAAPTGPAAAALAPVQAAASTAPPASAPTVAANLPDLAASRPTDSATAVAAQASAAASGVALAAVSAASAPSPEASASAGRVASLQETVLQSPYTVPAAASLVVLLAALGAFRLVRGRHTPLPETDFLASRYEGGSRSFGAGGPDTMLAGAEGHAGLEGEALSQLGAMSDVDPVAEADVYLAYGRDLQAEEILREAMRAAPQRLDVPVKLLEVLALRRDAASFDGLARQLYETTGGAGPEWAQVASMGRTLDPDNPIYASAAPEFDAVGQGLDEVTPPAPEAPPLAEATLDNTPAAPDAFAAALSSAQEALGPEPEAVEASDFSLDLGQEPDLSAPRPEADGDALAEAAPQPERSPQDLEVDLGAVDLTADETLEPASLPPPEDPLQRKLALAHEFLQIGDLDAARDLLDEVLAQADGALKDRARELLDTLG